MLAALAVEGRALEPLRLLAFADFLDSVASTCAAIRRVSGPFPTLKALAENCGSFKNQIADVRSKIDPSGEVNDNASPELSRLRTQLRKQRSRLRSTLESYLRGKDTSRYLQDQVVSDRDGRYVLVVKAEHRTAIPGIIHGSSGSGASLYLEPLSTVEINNEIVALEQQEREEVHRILRQLTDSFRAKPVELRQAIDAATELDVIQAKVRFAHLIVGRRAGRCRPTAASSCERRAIRCSFPASSRRLDDERANAGTAGEGSGARRHPGHSADHACC